MGKTGVLSVSPNLLRGVIPLKRFYLLFDKLYLEASTFKNTIGMLMAENEIPADLFTSSNIATIPQNDITNNLDGIGFLMRTGFADMQEINAKSHTYIIEDLINTLIKIGTFTLVEIMDQSARTLSLVKRIVDEEDTYPLLICPPGEKDPGRKTGGVKFFII